MFTVTKQKFIVAGLAFALLGLGFGLSRLTSSVDLRAASEVSALPASAVKSQPEPAPTILVDKTFYATDFKLGYDEGLNAGRAGQEVSLPATERAGYNEGFKAGYTDGLKSLAASQGRLAHSVVQVPRKVAKAQRPQAPPHIVNASEPEPTRLGPKTKAALTIAAPAAVGAGIGALTGGKKGAGVGALIGGGLGAVIHLSQGKKDKQQ